MVGGICADCICSHPENFTWHSGGRYLFATSGSNLSCRSSVTPKVRACAIYAPVTSSETLGRLRGNCREAANGKGFVQQCCYYYLQRPRTAFYRHSDLHNFSCANWVSTNVRSINLACFSLLTVTLAGNGATEGGEKTKSV
jgi:hypothetical protein